MITVLPARPPSLQKTCTHDSLRQEWIELAGAAFRKVGTCALVSSAIMLNAANCRDNAIYLSAADWTGEGA